MSLTLLNPLSHSHIISDPPPPLTVSLTVKKPFWFLTTSLTFITGYGDERLIKYRQLMVGHSQTRDRSRLSCDCAGSTILFDHKPDDNDHSAKRCGAAHCEQYQALIE